MIIINVQCHCIYSSSTELVCRHAIFRHNNYCEGHNIVVNNRHLHGAHALHILVCDTTFIYRHVIVIARDQEFMAVNRPESEGGLRCHKSLATVL